MKYLTLLTLCSLLFFSCDDNRVFEEYKELDEAFWHKDSITTFSFQIQDPELNHNLFATFRNASSYPFYNIYFQYTLKDSLDSVLTSALHEAKLFDEKTGKPLGSGLGDLFDHTVPVLQDYQFTNKGEYSLSLQQFMRLDTLPFVLSVGARVERAGED